MKIPNWVYAIPYEGGGRTLEGADCWGLIVLLYKEIYGRDLPEFPSIGVKDYRSVEQSEVTSKEITRLLGTRPEVEKVISGSEGDLLILRVLGEPVHIALAIDDKHMIHTGRTHGVVVENYMEQKWKSKIMGIYKIK